MGQKLQLLKPDHRGKSTLDVLFNDTPDSPPPNARVQRRSVREWLAQHRQVESCADCHQRIGDRPAASVGAGDFLRGCGKYPEISRIGFIGEWH